MHMAATIKRYAGVRSGPGWLVVGLTGASLLGFFLFLGQGSLQAGVVVWYNFSSGLNGALGGPVSAAAAGLPLLAAFLFGLLGTTAPCQLSTNAAALAYVLRQGTSPAVVGPTALGYGLGKVFIYTVLGAAALLLGTQGASNAIPLLEVVRKALGPLMIVLGLVLLGLLRPNFLIGYRLSAWLQDHLPRSSLAGGGVLGLAFGLAFCPTLFLLFFGLTVPLALRSAYGALYPPLFALGTLVPLAALALVAASGGTVGARTLRKFSATDRFIRPAAAVILLLAGFNDTFVYWLL